MKNISGKISKQKIDILTNLSLYHTFVLNLKLWGYPKIG